MNKFKHFNEDKPDFRIELDNNAAAKIYSQLLNKALDAHLVQRVVDDKKNTQLENIENKYTLKKLPDGKVWMMENLREKVEGAVWNEQYNCYMYTWEQAKRAVPKGFHLPSAREFMELCLACGYLDKSDEKVAKRLQKECGFVYSGYSHPTEGSLGDQGTSGAGYWWSSTWYNNNAAYDLYFNSSTVYPQTNCNKCYGFAVRCIKN